MPFFEIHVDTLLHNAIALLLVTCGCVLLYKLVRTSCPRATVYFNFLYTSLPFIDSPASYHSDHPV